MLETGFVNPSVNLSMLTIEARDLTLDAAQAAGSGRVSGSRHGSRELTEIQIKKLLDSRFEREVLDGMRRVVSVGPSRNPWKRL